MLLPDSIEVQFGWINQYSDYAGHLTKVPVAMSCLPHGYYARLVTTGHLDVGSHATHWHVHGGSVLLLPSNMPITTVRYLQTSESIAFGFRLLLFGSIDITPRLTHAGVWHPTPVEYETFSAFLHVLLRLPTAPSLAESLVRDGVIRALIGLCWNTLGADDLVEGLHPSIPKWLVLVMQEIRHFPGITVTDLERISGYSHSQFFRLFQQYLGVSPRIYLQQHRLDLAQRLLATTDMDLSAIAEHIGFMNATDFTRFFKKMCMVRPSEYRNTIAQSHMAPTS